MQKTRIYFKEGKGTVIWKEGEEELIYEWFPKVVAIEKQIDLKTGRIYDNYYFVELLDKDKKSLGKRMLDRLSKIDFFGLWGAMDAQLTPKDRNLLYQKLQNDVANLKEEVKETLVATEMGFYEKQRVFILGDKAIGREKMEIKTSNLFLLKDAPYLKVFSNDFLCIEAKKFMELLPKVTVPLFYGSLIPIIKYIIPAKWRRFVLVIVGPPGHLKTTMTIVYLLILKDESMQKCTVRGKMRTEEIRTRINQLKGLYFLLDDVHPTSMYQNRGQQEDRVDAIVRHVTTNDDTADVVITAENVESLGGFSAIDRMLIINVPRMTSDELGEKKRELSKLKPEMMSLFVQFFTKALIDNWEDARRLAESFFEKDEDLPFEVDNTIRASAYVKQFLLVEELCRKYMFSGDMRLSSRDILIESMKENYTLQMKNLNGLRDEKTKIDYAKEVYCMIIEEAEKVEKRESSMIYYDEEEYRMADAPKFLYEEKRGNKNLLVTRDNLQLALMQRKNRVVQIGEVIKCLKDAGVLLTYGNGEPTKKIIGFPRHLVISLYCIEMYARDAGINLNNNLLR